MKINTWWMALLPGGRRQPKPASLDDIYREHFALRTAATFTAIAATVAAVGGWLLILSAAVCPLLFWPAMIALVFAILLGWKLARIWRRLRTLDAFIR